MNNYSHDTPSEPTKARCATRETRTGPSDADPPRRKPGEHCAVRNGAQARLITEVARMYYEQRRTQLEIATCLNVSQGTICRFLKRAEKQGIVRTTISPPFGTFVDLEELLERKFGLSQVVIAQATNASEESIQDAVGAAAAHFLETTLKPKAVIGVTSWMPPLFSMFTQRNPASKYSN